MWKKIKTYCKNLLIVVDQTFNAILGGMPDETLSARAWRLHERYWYANFLRLLIDGFFLIFFQKNHCKKSYDSEIERKHLPDSYN